jgi:hypothetical protein
MVGFVRFSIFLVILTDSSIYGTQQRSCKLVKFVGVLDCVNVGLQNVPILKKDRDAVKVLDLRQNNITKLDSKIITTYPNLKLIDVRENPHVCGGVFISVTVKSDCEIRTNIYLSPSKTPSPSKHSTTSPPTIQTTLRPSPTKPLTPTTTSPCRPSTKPSTHIPRPSKPHTRSVPNTQSRNTPQPPKFSSSSSSLPLSSSSIKPKNPVTVHRRDGYPQQLAVYLSTAFATLFVLIFCAKCRPCTRCRRRRTQENRNIVMATVNSVGNIAESSSGSSIEIYDVTSV